MPGEERLIFNSLFGKALRESFQVATVRRIAYCRESCAVLAMVV